MEEVVASTNSICEAVAPAWLLKEAVRTSPVFMHVAEDRVDDVVSSFKGPLLVLPGTAIIMQGAAVESDEPGLFVLARGCLECFIAKGTEQPPGRRVFTFNMPGQTFGHVALLYGCERMATIIASEASELWHLDREGFKIGMDDSRLGRIVARHGETVAKYGITTDSVAREFGIFDINLPDGGKMQHNLLGYYNLCKESIGMLATFSCFANWNQNKKVNGAAKGIPAVRTTSNSEQVRIFFFDDNIEWEGKENSSGICNLRDVETGHFVEFTEGVNGFRQESTARYTVIHPSSEYSNVVIKANILDAMEFPSYFTDIIDTYSKSGEKIIVYMDVNSTILSADSISSKGMTSVLLGTLLEFMTLEPREVFVVEWEARAPVKVEKRMTLKQLAKKICDVDKKYYDQFYTCENCLKLLDLVIPRADVQWSRNDQPFTMQNFKEAFEHYCAALVGSTNDIGLVNSWFDCYRAMQAKGNSIVLNSFGMDVRPTILKTVKDEREIVHVSVSISRWNPKDVEAFNKIYELSELGRQLGRLSN
jgi:hypothetical protein